jgi:integrase
MPAKKRFKTRYPGVFYIEGVAVGTGKPERVFYIRYRKGGKAIEEKAGRQYQDDMTPARAATMRAENIKGHEPTNYEKRKARQAGKEAEAKRWTFDRLWIEYKRQKPGLKGIAPDETRYNKYLKSPFGDREPKELIPLDTDRLRLQMLKSKSPQTVKLTLSLLLRISNFGVQKRLSEPLPFKVEIPTVHNEKTEDLTPTQLSKLLEAIEKDAHPQAGNLMRMALFTGMRRGEMFKLKWKDMDFERGFISIRDPKGGPDQKIPLNDGARQVLEALPKTDSAYVFPGRNGGQRVDIHHQVNKIRDRAGLPKDFRALHGLRHVFASMLASSGQVDLYTLQKLLTHKIPLMTQRYAHLRDDALKRASSLAGDIINEAASKKIEKVVNLEENRS